jgi:aminoglycoside phosphotransferase (APT) family kinase protein
VNAAELVRWVEHVVGAPVLAFDRVAAGASRATYIAAIAGQDDLVVRADTGDGPMAGTELTLSREAEAYAALWSTGVRIPRLHAVAADGSALLVDRARGSHLLADLPAEAKRRIYDDYLDCLIELHSVDVTTLDLPSYHRPTNGLSHAVLELDLWGRVLDEQTTQPWPLAHFARAVLGRLAPVHVARTVFCHGDVGPGNFVHDGRRVTAMLDWEFSHIGDPMDDLAWWVFRGHDWTGGCGDLAAQLRRWSAATSLAVDPGRIEYYRAVVMFRWLVSVAAALDHGGSGMDRSVYFRLVPILSVRLTRALAALLAVPLAPLDPPQVGEPSAAAVVLDALGADLDDVIRPAITDPDALRRLDATSLYLDHLRAVDRIGAVTWRAELDDVARWTGRRPQNVPEGQQFVADALREQPPSWESVTNYFWRHANRLVALWPATAEKAFGSPTVVPSIG